MTPEELRTLTTELLGFATSENQARTSEILTAITEEHTRLTSAGESAATKISELTANNETLRDVNAKLFLKVGEIPKGGTPQTEPPATEPPANNKLTFENLFNDKGELI